MSNSVIMSISQCLAVAPSTGTITGYALIVALVIIDAKKEAAKFEKQRLCQEVASAAPASVSGLSIDDIPDFFASNYGDVPLLDLQSKEITGLKWPEQSGELLGLIVNSLRVLDGAAPQDCPEPRRRPQSARKIALVLDKAPKHLQPDLVALVPKLVEHSEPPLAACALLDRLQKPDAESTLRIPVFGALSQLECQQ